MRLRHIKGAEEEIAESPYVVQEPKELKGKWHEFFGNNNPIRIEVGMGKGKFIMELAEKNPDVNYVGIERYSSVLLRGLQKRAEMEINNIYFMRIDALELEEVFDEGEVDRIYLNFSDPWPKSGHEKRRLTYGSFLAQYRTVMDAGRTVTFKTDNRGLFDYSLLSFAANGWKTADVTYDLHNSEWNAENIVTEYERNFSEKGFSINRVVAFAPEQNPEVLPKIEMPEPATSEE